MTEVQRFDLIAADGTRLCGLRVLPPGARAVIALLHGLGEHAGRYERFAAAAAARGIAVVSADLRGHGRSQGRLGYVDCFDEYVIDADAVVGAASAQAHGLPWFLMGHSMGGVVALDWLGTRHPVPPPAGVVLSSAALKIGGDVSPWLLKLAPLISALAPGLRANPLDPAAISSIEAEAAAYAADPLVMPVAPPARTAAELLAAAGRNGAVPPRLYFPLYAMHGANDPLIDVAGTRALHAAWGGADKTLRVWPESRHEVLNDRDGAAALGEIIDWISARV